VKKRSALFGLLIAGLVIFGTALSSPATGHSHWRGGVFIGVGPWWGPPYWGPYPYWWYPPPYYYPPTVVIEQPRVYIEQPPPVPAPPPAYWYYCMSAKAYYPSVQTCPEDWVKVPARP
jgi:hypothetical protein